MEGLIARTIDRLDLDDAARGVWDILAPRLRPVLEGDDEGPLLVAAERAARGVALTREASVASLLEGYMTGCDALGEALRSSEDQGAERRAGRLAQIRPDVLRYLAAGYASGLEDIIDGLEREAQAASPVDDFTGAMKPSEIVERLALEMVRCQRMDLSLGVVEMAVDVGQGETRARDVASKAQRDVGECLRDNLRRYDSVGLSGRGGFLLVFPDVSRRGLAAAAERLRQEIAERAGERPRLVVALAHYDDVDVGAGDVMVKLERGLEQARRQGESIAWA